MKNRKIIIIGIIFIIGIFLILMGQNWENKYVLTTDEAINKINEEVFDLDFNLDNKLANIDGKEEKITDLLSMSNETLNDLIEKNEFEQFVNDNFIGDIEKKENTIEIRNPYSTNKLIIKINDEAILNKYNNIIMVKHLAEDYYVLEYDNSKNTKNGYLELKEDNNVEMVVKDKKLHIASVSNASNIAWGVNSTGMNNYTKKLNYKNNKNTINVAVIDSGINTSHEAFKTSNNESRIDMTHAYNYIAKSKDVTDDLGHGTWVSGVITESTPDNVVITPLKIIDDRGHANNTDLQLAIINVYQYVDIINMSLGDEESNLSNEEKEEIENVLKLVRDSGTIMVAGSGNNNSSTFHPASSSYTIAVGSIDSNNNKSSFSNYGPEIDFVMPGENLKLPSKTGVNQYDTENQGRPINGTSLSTPFLAAAIALVKTEYPNYNEEQIVDFLKQNTDDLGATGKDDYYGYGTVNFNNHMFSKPVIANLSIETINWGTSANIKIDGIASKKIKYYATTTTNNEPSTWNNVATANEEVSINVNVTNNGVNYVWLKDLNGNVGVSQSIDVNYIDNVKPILTSLTSKDIAYNSFKIEAVVQDQESGISKIKWYYKKTNETNYQSVTDSYGNTTSGELGELTKIHEFKNIDGSADYNIYVEIYDLSGNITTSQIISLKTQDAIVVSNKTGGLATVKIGGNTSTNDMTLENNISTINVTSSKPVFVIATYDNGKNYTRLEAVATNTNNSYNFSINTNVSLNINVVLVGDINLDGNINETDALLIKKSKLASSNSNYEKLNEINRLVADVNKSGTVTALDALLIRKSLLTTTNSSYLALNW